MANTTAHGTPSQLATLISRGLMTLLIHGLKMKDNKAQAVSIEAVENVLKKGETFVKEGKSSDNPFAVYYEQCDGLDTLEKLQYHQN